MTKGSSAKTIGIVVVGLVVAAGLFYWGYSVHKQREQNKAAALKLVSDTSARLRDALNVETAPPTTDRTRFVKKLDDHAATAERNLQVFRRIDLARHRALTDAADDYLLTAQEILKRQAESHRYRLLLAQSSQALLDHMRADNRTGAWVQEAVKAKERVNKDYRGYNLAAGALDKLLESFPASQAKIMPYVGPPAIIPETLAGDARKRVQQDTRQVAAEFEKLQQLGALR